MVDGKQKLTLLTLFGNMELKVYVPEGYEEVVAKGLRIELGRVWFNSPKKTSKKAIERRANKEIEKALLIARKNTKIQTNIGEKEDIW